jgi:general secretion pathway protein D
VLVPFVAAMLVICGCEWTGSEPADGAPTRVRRPEPLFRHSYEEATRDRPPAPEPDLDADEPAPDLPPERPEVIDVPDLLVERVGADGPTRVGDGGAPADGDGLPALRIGATEPVQISVEGMPLYDFVNLVFGKLLQVNYTVAPELREAKDTVTLNMTEPMEPEAFYSFVMGLLADVGVYPSVRNRVIVLTRQANTGNAGVQSNRIGIGRKVVAAPPGSVVVQIVPLHYISGNSYAGILRRWSGAESLEIVPLPGTAAVSLKGPHEEVKRATAILRKIDRPSFADREVKYFTLVYTKADAFVDDMERILRESGIPVDASEEKEAVRLVPLRRQNAVVVFSPRTKWTELIQTWYRRLDTPEHVGQEPGFFVYRPQNRAASEVAQILEDLKTSELITAGKPPDGAAASEGKGGPADGNEAFTLALDEGRNAIVIFSTPQVYRQLLGILKQLDTEAHQVLIEAIIAEVTLNDQLEHGVEWFLREHVDEGDDSRNMLQTLDGLGIGGAGFNYAFSRLDGNVVAKLNAFTRDNVVNIVSRPHLVVLDGKSASISVGTEVPTVSSEQSTDDVQGDENTASILRNVQYRSTGTTLNVTPVVQSSGVLMLEIDQELSEAQTTTTSSIDSPTILNRNVTTSLNLRSGQTVLLGGLISENESTTQKRVPVLGRIPGLGRAFRVDSKGGTRTELIIQITPYILGGGKELEEITRIFDEERSTVRTGEMGP